MLPVVIERSKGQSNGRHLSSISRVAESEKKARENLTTEMIWRKVFWLVKVIQLEKENNDATSIDDVLLPVVLVRQSL